MIKLDLGCGKFKKEGFLGVDEVGLPGVDVVWDLTRTPWPWKDGTVDEVVCSHFFEHLDGPERMRFMDELYRILKPNAQALIITPYAFSRRAIQDPTHKWPPVAETSFLYFNLDWRRANGLEYYPIHCDFDFSCAYAMEPAWRGMTREMVPFPVEHYLSVVEDLHTTLVKKVQAQSV